MIENDIQLEIPTLEDYKLDDFIYEKARKIQSNLFWKKFIGVVISIIGGIFFIIVLQGTLLHSLAFVIGVACAVAGWIGIFFYYDVKSIYARELAIIKGKVRPFEDAFEKYYLQQIDKLYNNHLFRKHSTNPKFADNLEKFGALVMLLTKANSIFLTKQFNIHVYREYYIKRQNGISRRVFSQADFNKEDIFHPLHTLKSNQFQVEVKVPKIISPEIYFRTPKKIDWHQVNEARMAIGRKGEDLVIYLEKEYFKSIGRFDLADKVKNISAEAGDGCGYDVLSFFDNGNEKYIEVKSTTQVMEASFYISRNELNFLQQHPRNSYVYRVALNHGDEENSEIEAIIAEDVISKGEFLPIQYRVTLD